MYTTTFTYLLVAGTTKKQSSCIPTFSLNMGEHLELEQVIRGKRRWYTLYRPARICKEWGVKMQFRPLNNNCRVTVTDSTRAITKASPSSVEVELGSNYSHHFCRRHIHPLSTYSLEHKPYRNIAGLTHSSWHRTRHSYITNQCLPP